MSRAQRTFAIRDGVARRLYNGRVVRQSANSLNDDQIGQLAAWIVSHATRPKTSAAMRWIREKFDKRMDVQVCSDLVDALVEQTVIAHCEDAIERAGGSELALPGFGLPLTYMPELKEGEESRAHFPVLGTDEEGWKATTLLIREICMIAAVEELTNKPEWWLKCRNPEITKKWKEEALAMDWAAIRTHADFTPAMADAVLAELQHKATMYEETGLVPVMDYCIAALKSDKLLTPALIEEIKAAVSPLENVPDEQKDWHPGSNKQVLDLVHPSLWPLVYGKTRILPKGRVGLRDALDHCGGGSIIPEPLAIELKEDDHYSTKFQWLPSDVYITPEGKATFDSYINNLHPVKDAKLYPLLAKLVEKSLPAWDVLYRWPEEFDMQRLTVKACGTKCSTPDACEKEYECSPANRPITSDEPPRDQDERWEDGYEESPRGQLDMAWFQSTHPMDLPDPDPADLPILIEPSDVRTSGFFDSASRIQVIVKLANIHLTPESPSYDGGSWHVEGLQNEHICATALYYYDCENVTDSRLDFRTRANREDVATEIEYEQNDDYSIQRTFAMDLQPGEDPSSTAVQRIGSVLTRPGRALFFPNLFQHHVSPFRLADPSRPGHRKIVALFLVDPKIPVISTANVPPQRRDWWEDAAPLDGSDNAPLARLPAELRDMVMSEVDFPYGKAEADRVREELMKERSATVREVDWHLNNIEYGFCEH